MPRTRLHASALLAALALVLPGCDDRPNVVIVVIDTLRADHLSSYGYPRATSPHLDRLAAESVVFEQAFTVMGHTLPAHVSLFTGVHPASHHVLSNGMRYDGPYPTLAERLHERGWSTAAFVSGVPLRRESGLSRSFDVYRESARDGERRPQPKIDGELTNARALEWLDMQGERPFFLFVHYYDVHPPFTRAPGPPPLVADAELERQLAAMGAAHLSISDVSPVPILLDGRPLGLREAVDAYDNQIRRVDALVEELRAELARRALLDDTLFIVTADHGEGLGQHGFYTHGSQLYEEQLRIPLIVRAPRRAGWSPARSNATVSLLDLVPTVLELAEIPPSGTLHGESLSRALAPDASRPPRAILAQRRSFSASAAERLGPRFAPPGPLYAARGDFPLKYIGGGDGPGLLFDLRADPMELRDLSAARPDDALRMRAELDRLLRAHASEGTAETAALEPHTEEALRTLGYVQ